MIDFFIPQLPKMPNQLLRRHWSVMTKEKNKWHRLVGLCCMKYEGDPLTKAELTLVRRSTRQPDFDGLAGSFKYVVDGLVKAKVIVDDNLDIIGHPTFRWEKCKQAEQGIYVKVEAA